MHPMFKIKAVLSKEAPFQDPDSNARDADAAETDGRAKVGQLKVIVLKETTVSTDHGVETLLAFHLLLHSDERSVYLIIVRAASGSSSTSPIKATMSPAASGCQP